MASSPQAPLSASAAGVPTPTPRAVMLAAEHFAAATLSLLAGAVGLLWIAPELAAGLPETHRTAGDGRQGERQGALPRQRSGRCHKGPCDVRRAPFS
jgi:hypothetical protein